MDKINAAPRSNPWRFKADAPLEEGRKYPYRPRKPTEAEDLLEELDRQFEPLDEDEGQCLDPACPDATTMPYHSHPGPQRTGKEVDHG